MHSFTKVLCFIMLMLMVMAFSCANADEGVFVPTYGAFMDRLCELAPDGYSDIISTGMKKDGVWYEGYMSSCNLVGRNIFQVSSDVSNGYVESFELSLSEEVFSIYESDFYDLIASIMMSIRTDYTQDDISAMKEKLLISTITTTPVDYMYQSANDGIYRYGFLKRYGSYIFKIEFSLQ